VKPGGLALPDARALGEISEAKDHQASFFFHNFSDYVRVVLRTELMDYQPAPVSQVCRFVNFGKVRTAD